MPIKTGRASLNQDEFVRTYSLRPHGAVKVPAGRRWLAVKTPQTELPASNVRTPSCAFRIVPLFSNPPYASSPLTTSTSFTLYRILFIGPTFFLTPHSALRPCCFFALRSVLISQFTESHARGTSLNSSWHQTPHSLKQIRHRLTVAPVSAWFSPSFRADLCPFRRFAVLIT